MNYYYCDHCQKLPLNNIHRIHHDTVYGLALTDENELFGRLLLEINQAGLSWDTILKKEENFRNAYSNFDIQKIAKYTEADRERLMQDAGIIRNRLKINAAIVNAQRIVELQTEFGSFFQWIKIQEASDIKEWVKLFKKEFKFVGGEIVNEFLMSIGRIEGSHAPECHQYKMYVTERRKWITSF
jgi:DNA-3-methyladenine glycosylase I